MQNAIGQYEFILFRGQVEPPRKGCLVIARPGVPGNSVWRDVEHGRPFKLRSVVDVFDVGGGHWLYDTEYLPLIGEDPQELIWEGYAMSAEGFKVIVLDVRIVDLHAIETPCGGFDDANNRARLECEWDLQPVPIT